MGGNATQPVDLSAATWRGSTYSNGSGGQCLQIADDLPAVVPVRDSKDPGRAPLVFESAAWSSFVTTVKRGNLSV
ncbi:DUF397 domain-containing protein [Streptomyces sp. B1866]|uniref:DUF397 domain-containing protein n=1 Tax=Streptomyces sp. B1866 TaxID=3075431 RepID=UPI00288F991F|nr:DUF397 domain-containing protein [Streptomyces sp. B1866]MDT3396376.1 DUF397 domain-containing protein [Streptomyces sp. B1866]